MAITGGLIPEGTRIRIRRGQFPVDPSLLGRTGTVVDTRDDPPPAHGAAIPPPPKFAYRSLAPMGPYGKAIGGRSLLEASIAYSLEHREAALAYAQEYSRGLAPRETDEFVGMYVNPRTLDYGEDGRRAVRLFLERGHEAGIIPHRPDVQFVGRGEAAPTVTVR
jgi:hypothetical protein